MRSTAWPRMAKVCLGEAAGSKVTRAGDRCQAGAGQAGSGTGSFISPLPIFSPSGSFFRIGVRRFASRSGAVAFNAAVAETQYAGEDRFQFGAEWKDATAE